MKVRLINLSSQQNIVEQFEDLEYAFPLKYMGGGEYEIEIHELDDLFRLVEVVATDWTTEGSSEASINLRYTDDEEYLITIVDMDVTV